ncbi:ankyrin-3-like isoform X1 [Biomphalaria glabrata]|uniref:Ankyrin-3-like isoform X1 n=2 Tax=Biomphalaria glabrata TaxID=6526 RepID=A0A9W3BHY3_BIOGL|nr:ankyrin-3-like isoform X1 [Biomphalaria glabrata]
MALPIFRQKTTPSAKMQEIFMTATEQGDTETVCKLLDELHITPDIAAVREGLGHSALSLASTYGQTSVAAELLKNGANPCLVSGVGRIPLHDACINGHLEAAQLLTEYMTDSDLNIQDNSGQAAVHLAAFNGETQVLKLLIQKGACLTIVDKKGRQPVHLAASRNFVGILQLLFDSGVDFDSQCFSGKTPLHYAAQFGGLEAVKFLVATDCDTTLEDKSSYLPAHMAAKFDKLNCLKFLIKQGTSIDAKQRTGKASTHIASCHGAFNVLHWLLDNRAEVNLQDNDGNTPAHCAAQEGKADCFNCCAQHDANLDLLNAKGDTPLDTAKKSGHPLLMAKAVANVVMCPLCLQKCQKEDYDRKHPPTDVEKSIMAIRNKAYASPLPKYNVKLGGNKVGLKPDSARSTKRNLALKEVAVQDRPHRDLPAKYFGEFVDPNQTFQFKMK